MNKTPKQWAILVAIALLGGAVGGYVAKTVTDYVSSTCLKESNK